MSIDSCEKAAPVRLWEKKTKSFQIPKIKTKQNVKYT